MRIGDRDRNSSNFRNVPALRRRSSWGAWIAIVLVLVTGAFLWSQIDDPPDNTTMSSTTTPADADADDPAPAAPSMAPANPSTPGG